MDLEPSEEQRLITATVRRFVRDEIVPLEADLDPDASELEDARQAFALPDTSTRAVEAWFLGPTGENAELFERLVVEAVREQVYWRRSFHPEDPTHITESIKRSESYLGAVDDLEGALRRTFSAAHTSMGLDSKKGV